jgi:hypothetical protein
LKNLITIIITFIVALGCANAQERLFDMPCEGITTDLQGNVFVTRGTNLELLSADGKRQRNYSEPTHGNITSVDAGIASKILVFYRESGTILLLNNELSPICSPINLFDRSLMTISLVAMGNPSKIVLYDEANQNLIITDFSLNTISQSHITFPGEFHPTDMQVVPEHRIALLDTLHGICLFDFFGTFEREIPIPGIKAMQLMKDQIIYLKDKAVYQYILPSETSPMSISSLEITIPVKAFHLWRNELYIIDDQDVAWKYLR